MDFTNYDPKMAFKLGFLARCAEEGLAGENLDMRVKQAFPWKWLGTAGLAALGGLAYATPKVVHTAATQVLPAAAGLAIGLPSAAGLLGGAALGYGAARTTEPDISAEDIKNEELAATYRAYAARLRTRKKNYDYKSAR